LYGSLDRGMGHKRRFRPDELRKALESSGFQVDQSFGLNRAGTVPWWISSKLLSSKRLSKFQLKVFDKTVWLWRRVERLLPWPALSLILVASPKGKAPSRQRQEANAQLMES
jgi:hypothetical protein